MSARTDAARGREELFVQMLVERFDVDIYQGHDFIRAMARNSLMIVETDEYFNLRGMAGAVKTLVKAYQDEV